MDELLARLRALVRRSARPEPTTTSVDVGPVTIDLAERRVRTRDGGATTDIHLTPTEWQLLEAFPRHPGTLLPRRQLLAGVWGPGYENAQGSLRLYMAQLRRKLEPEPARPRFFLTEPGMGYRFDPRG
jgi:two-component system, OmpR family, KDP operon response regulator KdpE